MPSRYEIVDEPDIGDDEVYHPDQSVPDDAHVSIRSLEPIIAGPITLKTVFFDPRWTPGQRKLCLCTIIVIGCLFFSLFLALFIGLAKVLHRINELEELKKQGLTMIPNLDDTQSPDGRLISGLPTRGHADKKILKAIYQNWYTSPIEKKLKFYKEQQKGDHFIDCDSLSEIPSNKLCRFNMTTLGTNCTSNNTYGYLDANPCILFEFRNKGNWSLKFKDNKIPKHLGLTCKWKGDNAGGTRPHPLISPFDKAVMNPPEGFLTNMIQPKNIVDADGKEHSQLAPLVMMQLVAPHTWLGSYTLICQVDRTVFEKKSLEDFRGVMRIDIPLAHFDDADND